MFSVEQGLEDLVLPEDPLTAESLSSSLPRLRRRPARVLRDVDSREAEVRNPLSQTSESPSGRGQGCIFPGSRVSRGVNTRRHNNPLPPVAMPSCDWPRRREACDWLQALACGSVGVRRRWSLFHARQRPPVFSENGRLCSFVSFCDGCLKQEIFVCIRNTLFL